jgi:hypothetical protein
MEDSGKFEIGISGANNERSQGPMRAFEAEEEEKQEEEKKKKKKNKKKKKKKLRSEE